MRRILACFVLAILFALGGSVLVGDAVPGAHAQTPNTITQQGLLTDDAGTPLNRTVDMVFSIGQDIDGTIEYAYRTDVRNVGVTEGRYNVRIGSGKQFPQDVFFPDDVFFPSDIFVPGDSWFPSDVFLRTEVDGETLSPPRPLTSTPYAVLASGLFNDTNLPLITDGNASIHVNNDASGDGGHFALFRGSGTTPFLEIAENGSGTPEMVVNGNFIVNGATKNFRIQHPTETDKVLNHYAVESSEVLNTYSGNVTLDGNGEAVVAMPEWFGPINENPRYNLTPIGAAAPRLHVAEPLEEGRFRIGGGKPGMRVSWEVTAVRDDPAVQMHKVPVVQDRSE